jgi:hypothetical protein
MTLRTRAGYRDLDSNCFDPIRVRAITGCPIIAIASSTVGGVPSRWYDGKIHTGQRAKWG